MIVRSFWAAFLIVAGLAGWGMFSDLLPRLSTERDRFHQLVERGEPGQALLETKIERTVRRGFNDHVREFYGILVLKKDGKDYAKNFRFSNGPASQEVWDSMKEGDQVSVVSLREDPSQFYAPSFLEAGVKTSGADSEYWIYVSLAVIAAGLWLFAVARLVIWPPAQDRQISSGTAFQR